MGGFGGGRDDREVFGGSNLGSGFAVEELELAILVNTGYPQGSQVYSALHNLTLVILSLHLPLLHFSTHYWVSSPAGLIDVSLHQIQHYWFLR